MDSEKATAALQHAEALDAQRLPWEGYWQELADVIHPRRALITHQQSADSTPDRSKIAENLDGTAMRANRTLANGQASRITPMGSRWFALRPPTDLQNNPAAQRWYQRCGEITLEALAASNFYNRAHEHYLDRGAFGIAATETVAGRHGKGLHFRSFPVGSYSVAHNGRDEVDTLARCYRLTPAQIIDIFPEENVPAEVHKKQADDKARTAPLEVVQIIRPRQDRNPKKSDGKNKPFESLHILKEEKHILAESGFDEFPIAVSRWELWGDSPYGWSPGGLALPEASQANFLEEMLDTLAETAAFPRVLYPSNLKGDVDFNALGLTSYDPTNGHKPEEWLTNGRYDIGKDRLNDKRRAIDEAFFVPLFNAISQLDRDATATEVRAIVSESRELFHPIFSNLVREFLRPILQRSFHLLLRQGAFPEPPAVVIKAGELDNFIDDPDVAFTSAMALALEQSQLANFADCINVLAPIAQSDPGAFDFIDTDAVGPAFFRSKGLPAEFIRSQEEIQQLRQARQQAQAAEMAKNVGQAVSSIGPDTVQQIADAAGA